MPAVIPYVCEVKGSFWQVLVWGRGAVNRYGTDVPQGGTARKCCKKVLVGGTAVRRYREEVLNMVL